MEVFLCLTKLSGSSTVYGWWHLFVDASVRILITITKQGWLISQYRSESTIDTSQQIIYCVFLFQIPSCHSCFVTSFTSIRNVLFCDMYCGYWILWFNAVVSAASSNNSCHILLERFNFLIITVRIALQLLLTSFSKLFSCYYCPLTPTPQATGDPYYLEAGRTIMDNLNRFARVPCGFAAMKDVRTGSHEDRWEDKDLFFAFCRLAIILQP